MKVGGGFTSSIHGESEVQVAASQAWHGKTDSSPPHCPAALGHKGFHLSLHIMLPVLEFLCRN